MADILKIYTDGACSNNQNKESAVGGWAYCLLFKGHQKTGSGQVLLTTNNRMEILAVIEALKAVKKHDLKTVIYSDSLYVINTMTLGWKKKLNNDLWDELERLLALFKDISFIKVKGHANDKYNNLVDELAVIETKK